MKDIMPKGIYKHRPSQGFQKGNTINLGTEGFKNNNWKDGKRKTSTGYVRIWNPSHPYCDNMGYVLRGRLVMEKKLGRYLKPKEEVHHKGIKYPVGNIENKQDDRIENLKLFVNKSEHTKFHHNILHTNFHPA